MRSSPRARRRRAFSTTRCRAEGRHPAEFGTGGTLQWFGFGLPNNIADALQYTAPDAGGAAAAAADAPGSYDLASALDSSWLTDMLNPAGDLASVFDGSWLIDLSDPADAVGATVSGLVG